MQFSMSSKPLMKPSLLPVSYTGFGRQSKLGLIGAHLQDKNK
jgi:hypothetical protein